MSLWTDLEGVIERPGLACSRRWVETWLDHYGDIVPHRFVVGERAGVPVGVVLVTRGVQQRRARVPVRTLHLGTAGEPPVDSVFVQRNRLLVTPEHREAFASGLLAALWREAGWDELVLNGFVAADAQAVVRAGPFELRHGVCRTVDLAAADDTGGEVVRLFGAKTRKNFRRSLRGLAVAATDWAETPQQARDILDDVIALHQASWESRGRQGAFASARFKAFHRDLTNRLILTNDVSLFRVRDDASTIAGLYGFIEGERLLSYQSGIAGSIDRQLSAGLVADVLCMQASRERGLRIYDHLSGDSAYKERLSTGQESLVWANARRRRGRWVAVNTARAVGQILRR
jgi:Acetyltransferase (GNAT) domain